MQCHNFIFKQGMKMTQKSFMSLMENDNDDESFNPKLSFELKCLLRCLIAVQMSEHSTTICLFVSNQLLIGFCLFVTHNFSNFTFPFLYFHPFFLLFLNSNCLYFAFQPMIHTEIHHHCINFLQIWWRQISWETYKTAYI